MVLNDEPLALGILLEVKSAQLQVARHDAGEARTAAMEVGVGVDDLVRDNVGLEDFLSAVNIAQEMIPGPDALAEACLDPSPLVATDDQRHEIEAAAGTPVLLGRLTRGEVGALFLTQFFREGKNAVQLIQG